MSANPCPRCGLIHPGCSAHTKNGPRTGQPCGRRPVPGLNVCSMHGGKAPRAQAAAARRVAEAEAQRAVVTLGLPIDITPTEALLEEVRWTAGHVAWLRQRVQELEDAAGGHALTWGTKQETSKGSGQWPGTDTVQAAVPSVWYELYARERQHLVAVCAAALKAGVEERRVRLAEQQGDLVAEVIRRILDALHLTPEQLELVPTVVPQQLRAIAGGTS